MDMRQIFAWLAFVFGLALSLFLVLQFSSPAEPAEENDKQPNILFIMADDLGYNDVGYHNPEMKTPTIDQLAKEGVILEGHYSQDACSPSRAALMSGKYPIRYGQQSFVLRMGEAKCLPLEEVTLAEQLKDAGYSTHLVGKWHLGYYNESCLPTNRGFDTAYGFYLGGEDYYDKTAAGANNGFQGRCSDGQIFDGYDFMKNDVVDRSANGSYSTFQYRDHAIDLINQHNEDDGPMFLYMSMQAPHSPLQAPQEYIDMYSYVEDEDRRVYSAMVTAMDDAIKDVVESLKQNDLYDNTVIVFVSDNGGETTEGGNNFPLRGQKATMWEGGVRTVAFVSGMVKGDGRVTKELMHISDWYPTLLHLAGVDDLDDMSLDGVNVWEAIEKEGGSSGREEILHNLNRLYASFFLWFGCDRNLFPTVPYNNTHGFDTSRGNTAIRWKNWKLLTGDPGPFFIMPVSGNRTERCLDDPDFQFNTAGPQVSVYLYDIDNDPSETTNVALQHPDVVEMLIGRLAQYERETVPYQWLPIDCEANPVNHEGAHRPWRSIWNITGQVFPPPFPPGM